MEEMTASEILRRSADDNWSTGVAGIAMALDAAECNGRVFELLANKIDAELAEARKEAVNESKKPMWWFSSAIKLGEDWPEPRDGEKFRDYLHRCFLPRPRFEDGEPVQLGDRVLAWGEDHTVERIGIEVSGGGCLLLQYIDSPEERLERPAPEALGADGMPIVEGETVWLDEAHSRCAGSYGFEDGNKYSLCGIERQEMLTVEDAHIEVDGREYVRVCTCGAWCHASWLTHTPPDTLERLRDDMYRTAEEWREADSVSIPDMNHWADRLTALIERKGGAE